MKLNKNKLVKLVRLPISRGISPDTGLFVKSK